MVRLHECAEDNDRTLCQRRKWTCNYTDVGGQVAEALLQDDRTRIEGRKAGEGARSMQVFFVQEMDFAGKVWPVEALFESAPERVLVVPDALARELDLPST